LEVEKELLHAIDELAQGGTTGEIRCLAALLACRGKVERRKLGWQHPFGDYLEREGDAGQQQVQGLAKRQIVTMTRNALVLNSSIMRYSKDQVCFRCADRLFARAHARFAQVLGEIPFDVLRDLSRSGSTAAENRAYRGLGNRYWELRRAGLLVSSGRTKPHLFPALRWVAEVPWMAAVALTLEQGRALTYDNCKNEGGLVFHMAIAAGCLDCEGPEKVALTPLGRELAHTHAATSIERRLRWIGGCRDEAMHALIDELSAPLPAVWVDGTPTFVDRTWQVDRDSPLRLLLKDRQLRMWLRRLVRRLQKMGLAQLIADRHGQSRYYFASGVSQLAKAALGLPEARFELPKEMQVQCLAAGHLLAIGRDSDGVWRLRPEAGSPPPAEVVGCMDGALRRLRGKHLVAGPADDGTYRIPNPDSYRWTVAELLLDPAAEYLTEVPVEAGEVVE